MSLVNKLFCSITGKGSSDSADSSDKHVVGQSKNANEVLKQFIAKSPKAKYTFDSERDAPQSELCRAQDGERQKECIMIQMQSTRLFQAMQDHGFFCVLPSDPSQTHIECTPKP
ncbi:uncharacterized protein FOMMEDRAFT_17982 [Fomitiporia mediterranea MF3/22]|uniref:uncharacterized protein n=1 Tax=Fomitiporia mediterranea (strain MF3/22) TaxID=694068 RepID=UPI00044075BF|nr:uncharacterized protein FOMMEDRAFT_17982 [Fomitiporia mediterranea MF3/22]EJD05752.1 hypothetical protein FOMMEDRAFT_17982 [Fomitiporia mediterranea MF3/22]